MAVQSYQIKTKDYQMEATSIEARSHRREHGGREAEEEAKGRD